MKIRESITRECCDPGKDLKPYCGVKNKNLCHLSVFFCIYCGQIWIHCQREDAHGGPFWQKVSLNDNRW